MFGHCVKVPQQNHSADSGLFLLQYAEEFYKNPITDYRLPITALHNWFDQTVVTQKRDQIWNLIEDKIKRSTKDGKLLEEGEEEIYSSSQ